MKKITLITLLLICILNLDCNNAGSGNDTANKDSTSTSDTLKSDPSRFSDPH